MKFTLSWLKAHLETDASAQEIAEKLTREGYDIDALHGDLTQAQRNKVMDEFREKTLQLLIATDVAARGIDVVGITHVINYELPDDVISTLSKNPEYQENKMQRNFWNHYGIFIMILGVIALIIIGRKAKD